MTGMDEKKVEDVSAWVVARGLAGDSEVALLFPPVALPEADGDVSAFWRAPLPAAAVLPAPC